MSDSDSSHRSSPPPGSAKREGQKGAAQRTTRFEVRQQPPPPPPHPLSRAIDLPDELPELRPRAVRGPAVQTTVRQPTPRVVVGSRPVVGPAHSSVAESAADVERARFLTSRPLSSRPFYPVDEPRQSPIAFFLGNPWLVLLLGAACLVIFLLASVPARTTVSTFLDRNGVPIGANDIADGSAPLAIAPAPPGQHSVLGPPTITADEVEAVLRQYNSPAAGSGRTWIALGKQYGIDPAYALAFFIHESTAGTNSGWAGLKPDGGSTHNVGNIICAGYPSCYGRFRDYPTWDAGIEDWYKLIATEYVRGRGAQTVEQIIPIYAPAFENDVNGYINAVVSMVEGWQRQGSGQ